VEARKKSFEFTKGTRFKKIEPKNTGNRNCSREAFQSNGTLGRREKQKVRTPSIKKKQKHRKLNFQRPKEGESARKSGNCRKK